MRPSSSRPVAALPLALSMVLAVLLTGCGADGDGENGGAATTAFEAKPVINLVVSNWTASALNVAVAEQLIERRLEYPVVPNRLDDTTAIYDGLADGSLDAVLEIWPSDLTDRDRTYFDRGEVIEMGPLGPVGRIGWFVPRYVVDEQPELASWEGFLDREAASAFATADTRPNGRLLGTSPDYQQFDEEIIDNLGLPLEVVFSGSEEDTIAALDASVSRGDPILVYWWTPTAAVAAFDLVSVDLPAVTDECLAAIEAGGAGLDCGYPPDELFKASTPGLADRAPEIDAFLRAFTLTTEDQESMLAAVESGGLSIDEAAAAWIEGNEDVWRAWLPE